MLMSIFDRYITAGQTRLRGILEKIEVYPTAHVTLVSRTESYLRLYLLLFLLGAEKFSLKFYTHNRAINQVSNAK